MGEEAKQEQAQPEVKVEEKKEEKAEEKKEEKAEEKKEEKAEEKKEEPKPPLPFVLFVDLHCVGCAKKIEKSILRIRGVEGVMIDMSKNQVTIKGVVEPQVVCTKIMKKTKRRAQVLSPLPATEGEPIPEVVNSQVSGLTTVELNVNMHCEACAEQLKRKILKMRGVRTASTELSSGKVTVTGTMDADKLVNYVYRRTKKQAKIIPQPEPEKPELAESKTAEEKPAEGPKADDQKKEEEETAEKKEGGGEKLNPPEEEKKEGRESNNNNNNSESNGKEERGGESQEEPKKGGEDPINIITDDEQAMQRMVYYCQPLYVIERIPPPQLFSDENPNACCIT